MCDVFGDIPVVLACIIVGEWLKLKDLASLDGAYAGSTKQKHFKEHILSSPECILSAVPNVAFAANFIKWIGNNSVRVRKLILSDTVVGYEPHLVKFGHYVHSAIMYNFTSMHVVTHYCQNITRISLHMTKDDVDLCAVYVALQSLPLLARLNFQSRSTVGVSELSEPLVRHQLCLKNLHIACSNELTHQVVTLCSPRSLQRLSVSCTVLWLTFILQECGEYEKFDNLHALELRKATLNTEEGLFELLELCPHIMHLSFEECHTDFFTSELSVYAIAHNLPHLASLNVCHSDFSDKLLIALAEYRSDTLEALYTTKCRRMTCNGYNELLLHCHKLHTLSLSLTDKMHASLDKPQLHQLRTLIIHDAHGVDDVVYTIAQHCNQLKYLKFTFSGYVYANYSFTQLRSEYLPALRTLVVCSVTSEHVFAPTLEALRRERPALRITHDPQALAYKFMSLPV